MSDDNNLASFRRQLMMEENAAGAGLDKESGTWKPHKSPEGGTDTIGFGHKLQPGQTHIEVGGKRYSIADGIPGPVMAQVFDQDLMAAGEKAKRSINKFKPSGLTWKDMSPAHKMIMAEKVFNVGSIATSEEFKWPSLARGMATNDNKIIRKEMVTSYTGTDGIKRPLSKRATAIADALELNVKEDTATAPATAPPQASTYTPGDTLRDDETGAMFRVDESGTPQQVG